MPEFRYLSHERFAQVIDALGTSRLLTSRILDSLTQDLNSHFVATLDDQGPPKVRLLQNLAAMNQVRRLKDGSVPLAQWLAAAELLLSHRDEVTIIRQALAEVASGGVTPAQVKAHPVPAQYERLKDEQRSDMLPFGFLLAGAQAGRSVARLQAPRHEDGQPKFRDGEAVRDLGTGWLLSADLLITCHHVINVREDYERDASESDLRLQASKTVAQFDYLSPEQVVVDEPVLKLEAWSSREGPLDYAILRLGQKQDAKQRAPLHLQKTALRLPADVTDYPSLNIIQHPLGGPKMVAFRNNQVMRAEGSDLWYYTDTQRGASGSPVLNDRWQVVALHKKWTLASVASYQGKAAAWVNVGTQIYAILDDLKVRHPNLLEEILAANAG